MYFIISIKSESSVQGESKNTLSNRRPQPHATNPWKEESKKRFGEKRKIRSGYDFFNVVLTNNQKISLFPIYNHNR